MTAYDLFAGPGGWEQGARLLGLDDDIVGLEKDADATVPPLLAAAVLEEVTR